MKIIIKAEPKEIAALLAEIETRRSLETQFETLVEKWLKEKNKQRAEFFAKMLTEPLEKELQRRNSKVYC